MGMVVQHNMNATNAYNRLNANVAGLKKASEKLSSGYRINRAGDDAAGLAISEKMRSQIKGLNQATRNAQDGINMIQTFEGAAQETHSILQRMKELATESANGTYDNPTDRMAIELEFGQLNDELNQIADTDFNGTIVLNGGEMADGLKAVDGEFNYANASKLKPVDIATGAIKGSDTALKIVDNSDYDKDAAKKLWETLGLSEDVSDVDITFVMKDGKWTAAAAVTNAKAAGAGDTEEEEKVLSITNAGESAAAKVDNTTFAVDADATKQAALLNTISKAGLAEGDINITKDGNDAVLTDKNGKSIKILQANLADNGLTLGTGTGTIATNKITIGMAAPAADAPATSTAKATISGWAKTAAGDIAATTAVPGTDDAKNDALAAKLESVGLKEGTITLTIAGGNMIFTDADGAFYSEATGTASTAYGLTAGGAGAAASNTFTLTYAPEEEESTTTTTTAGEKNVTNEIALDKLNVTTVTNDKATGNGGFKVGWGDHDVDAVFDSFNAKEGDYLTIKFVGPGEGNRAPNHISALEDSAVVKLDGTSVTPNALKEGAIEVTLGSDITDDKMSKELNEALETLGKLTFTVAANGNISAKDADGNTVNAGPTASSTNKLTVGTDGKVNYWNGTESVELASIKFDTSKVNGTWAAANNSTADFKLKAENYFFNTSDGLKANSVVTNDTLKSIISGGANVTNANAFKNSTARMTYTDNITLQTGARTKDAVNFTFKYNTDSTADMGNLKANLNLSSRADGLATANLSLANQKDANYAIDQIDKAINKTSLVRATFGSIQNRLEHKITNLTTTSENLTEAESNIRDTDMASEMMNYTKFNILQQAAQSMLAQANQQPQSVLQLLG